MTMLSYHNDPKCKEHAVQQAGHHRDADMLCAGTYGRMNGHFRGCSVGCDYYDITGEVADDTTDIHAVTAKHFGFPEWLERLRDVLFEGLPAPDRYEFHARLKEAIPVGVDLEPVKHRLTIARMNRLIDLQKNSRYERKEEVLAALKAVRHCAEAELKGEPCDWSAAWSAAWSAWSAARSAWSAARSAESAAVSAARSAWSAWSAAESAAESVAESAAESAARSAARSAAYRAERDELLRILRDL